jgi:putative transposase
MKSYQKAPNPVKGSIQILDEEALLETAGEGLMNLAVELGMETLRQMLEADVTELVGAKGKHNSQRAAYRHGTENTKVVLGGEKRSIRKPRVRSKDGAELSLPTLTTFQDEKPLSRAVLAELLAGVSTRKYARAEDFDGAEAACTSKSEVSRKFVKGLSALTDEFFHRRIEGDYPMIMMDGMAVGKMTVIAAMGIRSDGCKRMLGLTAGGTENQEAVKALLADLLDRGLAANQSRLFVLDGGKALHKAVTDTFGRKAVIQRCQVHKKRDVLAQLPKSERANTGLQISMAYLENDYENAKKALNLLTHNLEHRYPKAAASLREGLEETLTVHRLKVPGLLRQTLSNTNAMESANSVAASVIKRVKHWNDGEQILRYAAAGFLEAEKSFRRVKGYRQIPLLVSAIEKDLEPSSSTLIAKTA